ncbi:class I SAM-dependent methyltransferase [bacterium]|nr:class I SAM-dependent methyltransferase [bacterium]
MINKVMKSYPLQVFRHRIYLPLLSMLGYFGDFKRGIVTQKIIELNELGIDSSVGTRFETISYVHLKKNLMFAKNLGFDKFLDIGCGLGRSLVVANEVGFIDLYGVDISDSLISRCLSNISKVGATASLSCNDVADFEIPPGRLVIYLFNPFGYERMTELVSRLARREKETLVIYHNPKHSECFKNQNKIHEHIWNHFGLYMEQASFFLINAKAKN